MSDLSDEGYIDEFFEGLGIKQQAMRELERKLRKSASIQEVFPNVYAYGKVLLRWKGFVPDERQCRGYMSLSDFSDRVSLQVVKGNGSMFDADTEQALELLSKGVGPEPLVKCLRAIKRRTRVYKHPLRRNQ